MVVCVRVCVCDGCVCVCIPQLCVYGCVHVCVCLCVRKSKKVPVCCQGGMWRLIFTLGFPTPAQQRKEAEKRGTTSFCVCIYVCVCLSVCACGGTTSFYVCLPACACLLLLSVCLSVCVCFPVCLSARLCVSAPLVCVSVSVSLCESVCLSVHVLMFCHRGHRRNTSLRNKLISLFCTLPSYILNTTLTDGGWIEIVFLARSSQSSSASHCITPSWYGWRNGDVNRKRGDVKEPDYSTTTKMYLNTKST